MVWLIHSATSGRSVPDRLASNVSPVEILDRRFAEGEISEEDHRARREVLASRREPLARR